MIKTLLVSIVMCAFVDPPPAPQDGDRPRLTSAEVRFSTQCHFQNRESEVPRVRRKAGRCRRCR